MTSARVVSGNGAVFIALLLLCSEDHEGPTADETEEARMLRRHPEMVKGKAARCREHMI
jgi:hypothetical protein